MNVTSLVISENDQFQVLFEPAASTRIDEIPEKFHPPSTYKFPKRKFGNTVITERSFQSHWCDTYKWLHYDKVNDAAFCHLCMSAEKKKVSKQSQARTYFHFQWVYQLERSQQGFQ